MMLLRTRLYRPILAADYVFRERLVSILENHRQVPLTLVVGPAGYGKSIVVSQWLNESKSTSCWLSLEEDCNELYLFLSYLVGAVQSVVPESLSGISKMLDSIELLPIEFISKQLLNELDAIHMDLNIVLDDYHLIHSQAINDFLSEYLRFPPKHVKFTLISRSHPLLNVRKLKAYDKLFEIGESDLRFSPEEIMLVAEKMGIIPFELENAIKVFDLTKGWIIGIRLVLRNYRSGVSLSDLENKKLVQNEFLSFYLLEDAFAKLSISVQRVLMKLSLLNRFNLEMITSSHGFNIGENDRDKLEVVREIESYFDRSMFLISLEADRKWFRFHHYIQDFLKSQAEINFSREEISQFYKQASNYFETKQLLQEAIEYALLGNNAETAVLILEENSNDLFLRDQFIRFRHLLDLLPQETIEKSPGMLLKRAKLNDTLLEFDAWQKDLESAIELLQPLDAGTVRAKRLYGEYHALMAGLKYFTGNWELALEHSEKAMEIIGETMSYFREYAILFNALSLMVMGSGGRAIEHIKSKQSMIPSNFRLNLMLSHSLSCSVFVYEADLDEILNSSSLAFKISEEEKVWTSHIMACYFLSMSHYARNELDKVEPYIELVAERKYSGRPNWVAHTLLIGIFWHLALGQDENIQVLLKNIREVLKPFDSEKFDDFLYSIEVELALRQNNLKLANNAARFTNFDSLPVIFNFYFTQLTRVKLLIFRGDKVSMKQAFDLLQAYLGDNNLRHNLNFLIQVHILASLWYKKSDQIENALHHLRKSLSLAAKGKYVRVYLDLGEEMHELFKVLQANDRVQDFERKIIRGFEKDQLRMASPTLNPEIKTKAGKMQRKVSDKELAILRMVAKGYENKKIADEMCLSFETVKKYLYYTYKKLGVKNRTEAVTKAQSLRLLEID